MRVNVLGTAAIALSLALGGTALTPVYAADAPKSTAKFSDDTYR